MCFIVNDIHIRTNLSILYVYKKSTKTKRLSANDATTFNGKTTIIHDRTRSLCTMLKTWLHDLLKYGTSCKPKDKTISIDYYYKSSVDWFQKIIWSTHANWYDLTQINHVMIERFSSCVCYKYSKQTFHLK